MTTVKVTADHRITIPAAARRVLGIGPGDRLAVAIAGEAILLRKAPARPSDRLRGLAADTGWYEPDPVTYVRRLRDESEARSRERERLIDRARYPHDRPEGGDAG